MKNTFGIIFSFIVLFILIYIIFLLGKFLLTGLNSLPQSLSTSIVAASTTILTATLTVVLGKYYERKKEIESHYRAKKVEIYDEFLTELLKLFGSKESSEQEQPELVNFLREWNRKIIIWGGQNVLVKYINWIEELKKGSPTLHTVFLMEEFLLEIRSDLGHKNNLIIKGKLISLILNDVDKIIEKYNENPTLKLDELDI